MIIIEGWFKVHRSVFDHWVSTDAEAFLLWQYIIGMAAFEPIKTIELGRLINLNPGQFLFRGPQLADRLKIDRNKIYRTISLFEQDGMIDIQKCGKRYSIITVKNYSVYQGESLYYEKRRETNDKPKHIELCDYEGSTVLQSEKQTRNKRETIYKNDKTVKNKEKNIYSVLISEFTDNLNLVKALNDFILMRKQIKKPLTERAVRNLLSKLQSLSTDITTQIAILDQSINACWQDIYPMKGVVRDGKHGSGYNKNKILYSGPAKEYGEIDI